MCIRDRSCTGWLLASSITSVSGSSKVFTLGLVAYSNQSKIKVLKVSKKIKMSSSFKFCVLAAGEADIYAAKARAWEWDIAAGHEILEHAGGYITTHDEKKFLYGKENYKNLPIVAKRALSLEK